MEAWHFGYALNMIYYMLVRWPVGTRCLGICYGVMCMFVWATVLYENRVNCHPVKQTIRFAFLLHFHVTER